MWGYLLAAGIGTMIAGRNAPRTKATKVQLLGPKSGTTYAVEKFESAGILVVYAPDGSLGTFRIRTDKQGFLFVEGRGNSMSVETMKQDLGVSP
jgi:hypothetical protein